MEFILKIIFVLVLVGVAALVAKIVDNVRGNVDKISFREAMDLTNLPIITLVVEGNKLNFVLDTGSTSSVIDKTVVQNNKIKYEEVHTTTLYGIEGNANKVSVGNFKASYKNKEYDFKATIKDMSKPFSVLKKNTGVNLSGLLGSDFFKKYQYVLDFDSLIAYSKK